MRANALFAAAALNVALVTALAWLWMSEERSRWTEPAPLRPALDAAVAFDAAEPAEVSRHRETLERPLFAANRRLAPRSSAGANEQAAADALKDVRLLGTYGMGGKGGVIVVRGGKVERIAVGSSIGDWRVTGEEGRGAALERPTGERRRLELAVNAAAPAAPPAGQAEATPGPGGQGGASVAPSVAAAAAPAPANLEAQKAANEKWQREQIERINARRARRGLPPVSTN